LNVGSDYYIECVNSGLLEFELFEHARLIDDIRNLAIPSERALPVLLIKQELASIDTPILLLGQHPLPAHDPIPKLTLIDISIRVLASPLHQLIIDDREAGDHCPCAEMEGALERLV
jgi:hypothetical protein